jgi:hypothetical protein
LNGVTETSIWHQAFDNTLSRCLIMNVSNITSVPALNAPLTSSYLHPASGMMAHIDATPTSLLLLHVKDVPVIMATIHDPSLLPPCCQNNSAITTATHAQNLLLLCIQDNTAITMATHTNFKLQLFVGSSHKALIKLIVKFISTPKSLFLLCNEDNSEIMTSSLLLFCVKDAPAVVMAPHANFSLQLIVLLFFAKSPSTSVKIAECFVRENTR